MLYYYFIDGALFWSRDRYLNPKMMAKAFSKLEEVDISMSSMLWYGEHDQLRRFVNEMAKVDKPNLRKFGMGGVTGVCPDSDLFKTIAKIPEVNISNNKFGYNSDLSAFFEKIAAAEDLRLEALDISGVQWSQGDTDEDELDVDIMADALCKLREVKLFELNDEDVEKVLKKIISADNLKLRDLIIDANDGYIDGEINIDEDLLNSANHKVRIGFNQVH